MNCRFILRAAAALLLMNAACENPMSPGRNLEAARQRWSANGPASYQVTISRSCFCSPEMTGPVLVTVTSGTVASRAYTPGGQTVSASNAVLFPDVNGLFALIENAMGRRSARLEVQYHPTLGYPVEIYIDYSESAVDDEVGYRAAGFLSK